MSPTHYQSLSKMKNRIIILAVLMLTTAFVSFSQVCKISKDNDTVEVTNCSLVGDDKVEVTVENDSNDINANVTVTIEVTYKYGSNEYKESYVGKGRATANNSTVITIPVSANYKGYSGYKIHSVSAVSISGSKCM